ncbi:hypothetical protein RE061_000954 [Klebsiella aerogenes]|nr:hypothetical protein [Klebsiella aerogenes]EKZ6358665.1 hypothetical protein [Klebsiella aerogenes]ELS4541260.1 hypothetical protein [Klebsiella aerogenes]MBZ1874937.1 hypothetical protein [Klebsiella pneumoniae]
MFQVFAALYAAAITKPMIREVTNARKKRNSMTKLNVIYAASKVQTQTVLTTAARITLMTDINRLLASLKRRSAHAKKFGDSITFVKLEDIDALVEALELKEEQRANWFQMAQKLGDDLDAAEKRIAGLEESHAQVIQSRDHYKRISEEGLKHLAESCAVSAESFTCPRCGRTTIHPEGWHYCHKREAE